MTRLAYCQYLLVSQINDTLTNFADHCEAFSHDAINRHLRGDRVTPRALWETVAAEVVATAYGDLLFDEPCWTRTTRTRSTSCVGSGMATKKR